VGNISHINIGSGEEVSIKDLAIMIKKVIWFLIQIIPMASPGSYWMSHD